MNSQSDKYFAVAVSLVSPLSILTLENEGVFNAVLVGSPTTSNGVNYNEYLQHELLVTNIGEDKCIANLKTISDTYGTMESIASAPKAIKSVEEIIAALLSLKKIPTSITKPDGIMNKAVLSFFMEQEQLKLGVYIYGDEKISSLLPVTLHAGSQELNPEPFLEEKKKIRAVIFFATVIEFIELWDSDKNKRMQSVTHSHIFEMSEKFNNILRNIQDWNYFPPTTTTLVKNNLGDVIKTAISTGKVDLKNSKLLETINAFGEILPKNLKKEIFNNSKLPSLGYKINENQGTLMIV